MLKEILICIIIVIGVVALDKGTNNYTIKVVGELEESLVELRNKLEDVNDDSGKALEEKIEDISSKWKKHYTNLSYYIDHNELGNIELNIISAKSLIDSGEYNVAMSEVDKSIYELKYMEDRSKISIFNIF